MCWKKYLANIFFQNTFLNHSRLDVSPKKPLQVILKGAVQSPGYCGGFRSILCWSHYLVHYIHTQNAPIKLRRRYQTNFISCSSGIAKHFSLVIFACIALNLENFGPAFFQSKSMTFLAIHCNNRLDYQALFGKMSPHSSSESLSSGRIKERTRETAEIEPIAIDERRQF